MSFSATVKDELCRLELGKNCCMLSELAALYRTSGSLTFHGGGRVQVQYRVENTALARRIFRLLTARMAITPRLHYVQHARLGGRRTCVLTIGDEDSQRLMLALHLIDKDENGVVSYRRTIVRHHLTRQCCRRAYLRAAFLGAGTMTSPDKDYHFEITASEPGLVRELTRVLEKAELPVHTFQRKGQTVLYLKGAQQISDCLALMGASGSVFALEEIQKVAALMRFELERGNVDGFAKLLDYHWELSKKVDAGSSNTLIEQIFSSIEELIDGRLVCGAGGGGACARGGHDRRDDERDAGRCHA